MRFFRRFCDEWKARLLESHVSGSHAVTLREHAGDILTELAALSEEKPWPTTIRGKLDACVCILDPSNQRQKGRPAATEPVEQRSYEAVIGEVQHCFRLRIMESLAEKLWHQDARWRNDVATALECFRVLMDQPAVAESMIHQLQS